LKNSTAELLGFSSINVLLIFTPLAFIAKILEWEDSVTFFFALMALIPLAALLGMVTEELAMYTNQTLGGLMNATFGNATEVIISAIALVAAKPENDFAMLRIVQVSLVRSTPLPPSLFARPFQCSQLDVFWQLGSILSNCLLVLGCAFLLGGIKYTVQRFNRPAAVTNCAMLMLSVMTLMCKL
jgi:Ca2+:H+ antiporter